MIICYIYIYKLTNADRSVSSVNDPLFPVELTEIADWKSMSEYMLHFGKALTGVIGGNFGAYLYIAVSLFTKYLSIFLDVLSAARLLKQNKRYFGISANKLMLFSTTSPLE